MARSQVLTDGIIDRLKARLVAKGYTQISKVDFHRTLIAKLKSVMVLISLAVNMTGNYTNSMWKTTSFIIVYKRCSCNNPWWLLHKQCCKRNPKQGNSKLVAKEIQKKVMLDLIAKYNNTTTYYNKGFKYILHKCSCITKLVGFLIM